MFAMSGLRAFSLAAEPASGAVSCGVNGVFVGDVPLLQAVGGAGANRQWSVRSISELHRSRLLKFWDPAKHPRTGTPPNPGEFAPVPGGPETPPVIPAASSRFWPWNWLPGKKPFVPGAGTAPPGTIPVPIPGGIPALPVPRGAPAAPKAPAGAPAPAWSASHPKSKLPFMGPNRAAARTLCAGR
jgi:hypothetical protein